MLWKRWFKNFLFNRNSKWASILAILVVLFVFYVLHQNFTAYDFASEPSVIQPSNLVDHGTMEFLNFEKDYMVSGGNGSWDNAKVVILIFSAPGNKEMRNRIRQSWIKELPSHAVAYFLVGAVTRQLDENQIKSEQSRHNDFIRYNLVESYERIVIKAMVGLQWVIRNCQNVSHVIKIDDDAVPNVGKYLAKVEELKENEILGRLATNELALRWPHKNMVSITDYSSMRLPNFARGASYAFHVSVVNKIIEGSPNIYGLVNEDVTYTGVFAVKYGFKHVPTKKICVGFKKKDFTEWLNKDTLVACNVNQNQLERVLAKFRE